VRQGGQGDGAGQAAGVGGCGGEEEHGAGLSESINLIGTVKVFSESVK
jgi:hypothetical protein